MLIQPELVREALGAFMPSSLPALALLLRLLVSAQVTHGPATPRHTPSWSRCLSWIEGSFIVPGARVLAERPPHADPVTGRCRESKLAAAGSAERLRQPAGFVSASVCVECLPTS